MAPLLATMKNLISFPLIKGWVNTQTGEKIRWMLREAIHIGGTSKTKSGGRIRMLRNHALSNRNSCRTGLHLRRVGGNQLTRPSQHRPKQAPYDTGKQHLRLSSPRPSPNQYPIQQRLLTGFPGLEASLVATRCHSPGLRAPLRGLRSMATEVKMKESVEYECYTGSVQGACSSNLEEGYACARSEETEIVFNVVVVGHKITYCWLGG